MINALVCAHKSGDVIGLALRQLVDAPCVARILVADGPDRGIEWGTRVDEPTVKAVVDGLASDKIAYQHTTDCANIGEKGNRALEHVSADCEWILVVDSDEVYHEGCLARLAAWLPAAEYGRYAVKSLDPYPDFYHCFEMPDWKPRLYRWFNGVHCGDGMEGHQWVRHPDQRLCPGGDWNGFARVPREVCEVYHLNALRAGSGRVRDMGGGAVEYRGGGHKWHCKVEPLDRDRVPRSVRELGRETL